MRSTELETVTLANGDAVPGNSLMWLEECRARQRHVDTLLSIGSRQARADYIAQVAHREGQESARRLRERFVTVWEQRRAADAALRQQGGQS